MRSCAAGFPDSVFSTVPVPVARPWTAISIGSWTTTSQRLGGTSGTLTSLAAGCGHMPQRLRRRPPTPGITRAAADVDGIQAARSSTIPYRELLTALRILDPIEAWTPSLNHFTRLTGQRKHHLADPALAARLLGRTGPRLLGPGPQPLAQIHDGYLLGNLFESLAALSVRIYADAADARTRHLRERDGTHEIDFVLEHDNGYLALEVKLAGSVDDRDVRHLDWLAAKLGHELLDRVVLTTGPEAYRRPDGVAVVPLALLGP